MPLNNCHQQLLTARSTIDNHLITQLAQGDQMAFKALYDSFYEDLYYFSESLIHYQTQSQDNVVVAFQQLWDRREGFSEILAVKGFLFITVKNSCLTYLRNLATRDRHHSFILESLESFSNELVENRMIESEMFKELYARINELSPNYRAVIQLLFIEELSMAEAAERLQISPENLRKRKERALAQLRMELIKHSLYSYMMFQLFSQMP